MRDFLESRGYGVVDADSCQRARELFQASPPDVAVIDYRLHDGSAIDLLRDFRQIDADVPMIVLTAYGSIDLAVQAVKEGAEQFLTKPIEMPALHVILKRLLATRRLQRQQQVVATRDRRERVNPLSGGSPAIRDLAEQASKVMHTDSPILILGETGTGKSLLAKWLHHHGMRADEAFVDLNCAGLSPDFLETELFGHEKGAFTGATASKQGMLEIADGGTVFLDEIGDVDPRVQPKLLKVLEEKRFRRLGAVREREVDIRLIAATHHDLASKVKEGTFRSDLHFRISSIPLTMPALRDRKEDIVPLARTLLARSLADPSRTPQLTDDAALALREYAWPGNIRELRNVLERAALLCNDNTITRRDLRFESTSAQDAHAGDLNLTLQQIERQHIKRVLHDVGGKVEQASLRLGVPRSTLYQKIKLHGIAAAPGDPD
ncbi:sigma-54-dependent Fis family transcriptional regulator [Xanthomonas campestris pv. campestris]|uniref:Sigma-54 dependent transcriptional regulator, Fis family n=2 Tax=Xanthomonas campestris TaxID=339 RepID=B0RR36_XANCB|nr:sigma-54-dependent Fis family transcriptional regulator [Xanthomonas campestris pv. campestris]MCF8818724.1 sigma-54-dependent Fis family transcriptional regulator [Xanthomonas campestris]MCF8788093.1 sigma-54-dependent Fis family transcriptional regulator [Xanthomonas campestris pv. campestris]MCF8801467.1 sigma-54-dependent Fis family transcriptional regulator [Xanthomonas campestris pv. campestris]MCF8804749.1 sigma-54-dependent Fis family transcriptional regulator [Xanthomonas campestris